MTIITKLPALLIFIYGPDNTTKNLSKCKVYCFETRFFPQFSVLLQFTESTIQSASR